MITPEQRRKLEEALDSEEVWSTSSFFAGAEAYARIQSETKEGWTGKKCPQCNGTGENDEAQSCSACCGTGDEYGKIEASESDEEAANAYSAESDWNDSGSFLAGCARYRPLVEEMLPLLGFFGSGTKEVDGIIARAEKMLGLNVLNRTKP